MNQEDATKTSGDLEAPSILKDEFLRKYYLQEFSELIGTVLWKEADEDQKQEYQMMFESGFWALQKAIIRGEIQILEKLNNT